VRQQGLAGLLLVELRQDGLDLVAEGQVFRQLPHGLLLVDGDVFLVHVVHVARPGLGQIVDEAHPEDLQLVDGRVELAERIADEQGPQDVLRDGLLAGAEKLKPRARGLVQHAHFEEKIRNLLHLIPFSAS